MQSIETCLSVDTLNVDINENTLNLLFSKDVTNYSYMYFGLVQYMHTVIHVYRTIYKDFRKHILNTLIEIDLL